MNLSNHFTLAEFTTSQTAARLGLDNTPPEDVIEALKRTATGLEMVRTLLQAPIHINSGFRCAALNAAVGGARNSMHMRGLAADILCPQFGTPLEVCRAIVAAKVQTDQVIHEFGKWCHVSFAAPGAKPRGELLTIASALRGYETGLNPVG